MNRKKLFLGVKILSYANQKAIFPWPNKKVARIHGKKEGHTEGLDEYLGWLQDRGPRQTKRWPRRVYGALRITVLKLI